MIPGWSSSFISNRGQTKVFPSLVSCRILESGRYSERAHFTHSGSLQRWCWANRNIYCSRQSYFTSTN
ncbi:hypothetical protein DPMN_155788 [Dreissena polymorpha]|uniref:Uncharacterized protein n=1 Tax=Dreissena polymorpha TaxID=45954 RepID=A0A9D4FMU9_DREPO|nr:hypothetical protein DPMN_155788 [Dreissena polymorpha]